LGQPTTAGGIPVALTKSVEKALNDQIGREFSAAYLYLSMSAWCAAQSLEGFAHWLRLQAQEEAGHAMKILTYVEDRAGRVVLQAVGQPPADFTSPLDLTQMVLKHEQKVTEEIDRLYALATKESDYATQTFLAWFLTEQVEEEKSSTLLVERLKLAGTDKSALLLIDKELAARTTTE
jgi:ferritin